MDSLNDKSLRKIIKEWFINHTSIRRSIEHFGDFRFIWEILILLSLGLILLSPLSDWRYSRFLFVALILFILCPSLKVLFKKKKRVIGWGLLVLLTFGSYWIITNYSPNLTSNLWWCKLMILGLTVLIIVRPMNAVYGLMGTSGSIRIFFLNFFFISLIFSSIYFWGFFKTAGITYDVNQPHIDYQLYVNNTQENIIKVTPKNNIFYFERQLDSITFKESVVQVTNDTLHYQKINFGQVWRSTILTTLTQEPADLLTIASVYNTSMSSTNSLLDKQKSSIFEWILIFHIIISWIFFGVFISLLYNKFRYES